MKTICALLLISIVTFGAAYKILFRCSVKTTCFSMMRSSPNILIFKSHEQDDPILSTLYRLESVCIKGPRRSYISCDRRVREKSKFTDIAYLSLRQRRVTNVFGGAERPLCDRSLSNQDM
jgi:hypothetical protein